MRFTISPIGELRGIHCNAIDTREVDLAQLGEVRIRRASYVEPSDDGQWSADMFPVGGPTLGPFRTRILALEAELQWLESYWL